MNEEDLKRIERRAYVDGDGNFDVAVDDVVTLVIALREAWEESRHFKECIKASLCNIARLQTAGRVYCPFCTYQAEVEVQGPGEWRTKIHHAPGCVASRVEND